MNNEIWKSFLTNYEISNYGRVRSISKNKYLSPYLKTNFLRIDIQVDNIKKNYYIHRLVAEYFIPNNSPEKKMINHKDHNKLNNIHTNLEWLTKYEYEKLNPKKKPIKKPNNNYPIYQYSLDIKFIKQWDNITDILSAYPSYSSKYIHKCIKGISKSSYGYIWTNKEISQININNDEVWKSIKKYPGYKISNLGNIKSKKNIILKQQLKGDYYSITIRKITERIHRLVAEAFIENDDIINKIYVDHIDNNKLNNNVNNLRWVIPKINTQSYYNNFYNGSNRQIEQYDKNGKLLKKWDNLKQILSNNSTYKCDNIYQCLNKKIEYAYGFKWNYVKLDKYTVDIKHNEKFKLLKSNNVVNFPLYEISNYGNIRNITTKKFLKPYKNKGYYTVKLNKKNYFVHRLVALIFVEGKTNKNNIVNHLDQNKLNNYYKNLEWTTSQKNTIHSIGKKIAQIDCNNNRIINIFQSISLANKHLDIQSDSNAISMACNGKMGIAYGYYWSFVSEKYKINDILNIKINQKIICRKVNQIDIIKKIIINTFKSIKDAYNSLNIKYDSGISKCCNGKLKSAYGFKWEYV